MQPNSTPRIFRVVLVASAALSTCACASAPSARSSHEPSKPPEVGIMRRPAPPLVTATVADETITVTVEDRNECEVIVRTPTTLRDGTATTQDSHSRSVCDQKPFASVPITVQIGRTSTTGVTDAQGTAKIDISKASEADEPPTVAKVQALSASGLRGEASISLAESSLAARWRARQAAAKPQASQRAWAAAKDEDNANNEAKLAQVEEQLLQLERAKEPWSVQQLQMWIKVERALTEVKSSVPSGEVPPFAARFEAAVDRVRKLEPREERSFALHKKQEKAACDALAARLYEKGKEARAREITIERGVCWQTCRGNGNKEVPCIKHCDSSGKVQVLYSEEEELDTAFKQRCMGSK